MKKILTFFIIIIALIIFTPFIYAQDYILGEGDLLTISVYDQPDLQLTVRISGDGLITLPLIGQLSAAGQSVNQLSDKIEALLADGYIINPQVNIFIEEFRSRKATILGEVAAPGLYELKGQTTFLELISTAGGLTRSAANKAIIHRNQVNNQKQVVTVDLFLLMEEGQASQNIAVIDGDSIYIPKKKVFYVTGEVNRPNSYDYESGLTVIQALTKAGGINDKASPNRIKIIRSEDGHEQVLKQVKMDQLIQPNDVIVVPESYF